jgi:DnaJ domain
MPQFFIAIAILIGGYWLIKKFGKMQPAQSRAFTRKLAGGGLIGLSGLLVLRGSQLAVPLFLTGLGLFGSGTNFAKGFAWGEKKTGQKSSVSTSILSMELDHDSGTMNGRVLKGPFAGRMLSDLGSDDLQQLHAFCINAGDQSAALLEAWLDRHHAAWRDEWGGTERPGGGAKSSAMTPDEALAVLGLKQGASVADIRNAHRKLMKDFHPDRGGSDYLAAKINQAKDVLLQD